jgi:hypothetical protein
MNQQNSQMDTERRFAKPLAAIIFILVLSGYLTFFSSGLSVFGQWTYLLHTLMGVAASILLIPYLIVHYQRSISLRRHGTSASGLLSALLVLGLAGSGLYIAIEGQAEARRWLFDTHIWLAGIALLILLAHIVCHLLLLPERRKKTETKRFPSLSGGLLKSSVQAVAASLIFVLLATGFYQLRPSPYKDAPAVEPYTYNYGEHPFRPSQTETSTGGFFDARRLGESENCASCHQEIAKQWQASIHSQAASDKAYQTNINLLSERKGMAAARYCEGCHAPAALLSGQLTKGGKLDTPGHLQEGVSCMACHGIDQIEHVKGVASYRFKPPEPYLFAGSKDTVPKLIHNMLIRLKPEQHKSDLARNVLATPELCATCHAQFMDKDFNSWGWVKMQDDYTAWLNGPYSGQTRQTFAHAQSRRCKDCHFPLQAGQDPSANKDGQIKTHFNVGANTAIPWVTQNLAQLERVSQFLKADQMRISIDKPNRTDATESNRHVDPRLIESTEAPAYYYLGETVTLKVAVTNAQVGHAFPGGTSDINEAWIHFLVKDSQGRKIYESGQLEKRVLKLKLLGPPPVIVTLVWPLAAGASWSPTVPLKSK